MKAVSQFIKLAPVHASGFLHKVVGEVLMSQVFQDVDL